MNEEYLTKTLSLTRNLILLRRPARLKPDNFLGSKPELGPNATRKARAQLATLQGSIEPVPALLEKSEVRVAYMGSYF